MNPSHTGWRIPADYPPSDQQYQGNGPPPAYYAQQTPTIFPYSPVPPYTNPPVYYPTPPYYPAPPYAYPGPPQQFCPPQPSSLNQQQSSPANLNTSVSGVSVPYDRREGVSFNYPASNISPMSPSAPLLPPSRHAPPPPPRPAPPPSQRNDQHLGFCSNGPQYPVRTSPDLISQANYGKSPSEPAIGFVDVPKNRPFYPSLFGVAAIKNTKSPRQTPLPENTIVLWDSCKPAKLYFVQQERYVVSPGEDLIFRACKFPTMTPTSGWPAGSLSGHAKGATLLVTMENAWRLGINRERGYLVKGNLGEIAFYDTSTSPGRYVVVILPKEVSKDERQRLLVLLQANSRMVDEPTTVVDKFESGVESVFDSITQSMDFLVKKGTPITVHKNTKWLRKGTGNLVRLGGGLVSKGVHLVSDSVIDKETPKDSCQQHMHLFEALRNVRHAIENKTVTTVLPS